MKTHVVWLSLLFICSAYAYKSYDGYQVWRFDPAEHYDELNQLFDMMKLDIWSQKRGMMDLLIPPLRAHAIEALLRSKHIGYKIFIHDLQSLLDHQHDHVSVKKASSVDPTATITLDEYHTLDDIYAYLNQLAINSSLVDLQIAGTTFEGREILMTTVSTSDTPGKPVVWFDCGVHAREWVSPASCIYGLDLLTTQYGVDQAITNFLDSYDVYMIPVLNPDGYVYTWTDDRMWRKNRNTNDGALCVGVDGNRNYGDAFFGGIGSSDEPCAATYHGVAEFSDAETAAVRDAISNIQAVTTVAAHFSVHSYSQLWMYPYGGISDIVPEAADLDAVSQAAVDAIRSINGTEYEFGPHYTAIYPASGTAVDFAYNNGIVYTFLLELRDEGQFGFALPEEQILPTAEEMWAGVFAAVNAIP